MAAVTNLFYANNYLHDWFYDAGFDEAAGNAQTSNFGRGGLAADSILAEAQDYSGTNNASMSTPADGQRPRMRMFLWDSSIGLTRVNEPVSIAGVKQSGTAGIRAADVRRHRRRRACPRRRQRHRVRPLLTDARPLSTHRQ
jgi:hypothetical protein